jgi:hypothetical protein
MHNFGWFVGSKHRGQSRVTLTTYVGICGFCGIFLIDCSKNPVNPT